MLLNINLRCDNCGEPLDYEFNVSQPINGDAVLTIFVVPCSCTKPEDEEDQQ